jgi:hypothetical protein
MTKYTKGEVIKLIAGANKQISYYENKIFLERNRLQKIKENCPHEYVENRSGMGSTCNICNQAEEI